jgi:hypothetical protein
MKKACSLLALVCAACGVGTAGEEGNPQDPTGSDSAALCTVTPQELMITDLSVVEDKVRTVWTGSLTNPNDGAWQFGRLMTEMAGANDASDFTIALFEKWEHDQKVNSFTAPARPSIDSIVLNPWPKLPNGKLDLTKAPLRLLAIVDRFDLRKLSQGNSGEGRFVFGVLDSRGNPLSFTVILEYKLPAATKADVQAWANAWHGLGSITFPSAKYNTALQAITDKFAGPGANPNKPNGSSIGQIRSNEIALSAPWQLREFHLGTDGQLHEATVANAPDESFNGTATLASFINANEAGLIAGKTTIPLSFDGAPFRAVALNNSIDFWSAPGVNNNDARFGLSVNTCNGCHGRETNTTFLQVGVRAKGVKSTLSGFLTGESVSDPVSGVQRNFADLNRRAADLATFVCPGGGVGAEETDAPTERVE